MTLFEWLETIWAGAAPDEYPSDEQIKNRAKAYYDEYLQGASIDDLFEIKSKETLNENFVGIPAINNIFDREKTDYELAFEHFTKGTLLKENIAPIYNIVTWDEEKEVGTYQEGVGFKPNENGIKMGLKAQTDIPEETKKEPIDFRQAAKEAERLRKNLANRKEITDVLESLFEGKGKVDNKKEISTLSTKLKTLGYGALAGLISAALPLALVKASGGNISLDTILAASTAAAASGGGLARFLTYISDKASEPSSTNTESLNENFVGMGMVGNIFDREKTDYELAFEHFAKGTSLNEAEVEDEDIATFLNNNKEKLPKEIKGKFKGERGIATTDIQTQYRTYLVTASFSKNTLKGNNIKEATIEGKTIYYTIEDYG